MRNRLAATVLVASLVAASLALASSAAARAPAPGGACAAQALKSVTARVRDEDASAKMKSFAKVAPSKAEVGAGDAFFDARFAPAAGGEAIKYHVIMWCKGMKAPATMALQRKYD